MNIENAPFEVVASGNPHPDATFILEENAYSKMGKQILKEQNGNSSVIYV